ncbi:MAG TPA: hypothetical protein VEG24_08315, partial [Gaiellaceae bacterium]|nr:hypothetical protein [Gaiellaceae bacterium]
MRPTPTTIVHSTPSYTVAAGRATVWAAVEGIRLRDGEAPDAVAAVRALLAETECRIVSWWLSELSAPADVEAQLLEAGLALIPDDYLIDGLLATSAPATGLPEIEARPVASVEEFVEARNLQEDVFETPPGRRRSREQLAEEYRTIDGVLYAAWLDGRMAGAGGVTASSRGLLLWGGATAAWARGRGAYRALVRARWDDAVARGTPALTVGANPTSSPILRRLGFEKVVQFRRLEDVLDR